MDHDVSVSYDHSGRLYAIKIQSPHYELNVRIPSEEIAKLKQVASTPWLGGSLKIGQ